MATTDKDKKTYSWSTPNFFEELATFNKQKKQEHAERVAALKKKVSEEGDKELAKTTRNYTTTSNATTSVARGRQQNKHLEERGLQGAAQHAAWEKDHPNLAIWSQAAAAVPFAVAAYPFIAGSVGAAGNAAAATTTGQAITSGLNFAANAVRANPYVMKALPWINAGLTSASVASGIQDIRNGKFTPMTALELAPGTQLLGSPTFQYMLRHPMPFIFENLPYRALNYTSRITKNFGKDAVEFLRTPINENPFKAVKQKRLLRQFYRDQSKVRKLDENIQLPEGVTPNYPIEKSLELLKMRHDQLSLPGVDHPRFSPRHKWDKVKVYTHLPFSVAKEITDLDNPIARNIIGSIVYLKGNYEPGFATMLRGGRPVVKLNLPHLKAYNWDPSAVAAHEYAHALERVYRVPNPPTFIDFDKLRPSVSNYFQIHDNTELVARGSQIKNYFGFNDNSQELTGDMLKYAAKHYTKDTGLNNNMNEMFNAITDWDEAANWFNKHSLKQGGKLYNDVEKLNNNYGKEEQK